MRAMLAGFLLLVSGLALAQPSGLPAASPFGAGAAGPQFLPVDEAYQLEVEVREDNSLRVYWQIADTYYLYQHRFSFSLEDASGEIPLELELPPALEREDEFFGEARVYYDNADIALVPQRVPTLATLTVGSQGCADAGLCLSLIHI